MEEVVIFDLEFTSWPGSVARNWSGPGEYREVVQIGAVRLATATLEETARLCLFVRPQINPRLSDYFVALTGITNDLIAERGTDFEPAYLAFLAFSRGRPLLCYGRDDRILNENRGLYGLGHVPLCPPARNLAPWFAAAGTDIAGVHSGDLARHVGAPFEGRLHDALDDSLSLLAALRHVMKAGGPAPPWVHGAPCG